MLFLVKHYFSGREHYITSTTPKDAATAFASATIGEVEQVKRQKSTKSGYKMYNIFNRISALRCVLVKQI